MNDERPTSSRRKVLGTTGLALAGALTGTSVASASQETETGTGGGNGGGQDENRQEVMEIISDWEEKQRTETQNTMDKYGVPQGITDRRLIWYDVEPWRRIEIFRDATNHNFPKPHPDFFEQFIDYQVPNHKADELMEYDGSVMFERTTGVMSARCHTEWANFLALNLAHDIITDAKTVEEARRSYAELVIRYENGESPAYTQGLQFELPQGNQRDPDVRVIQNGDVNLEGFSAPDTETGTSTPPGTETTTNQG